MSDLMKRPDDEIIPASLAVKLTGQSRRMLCFWQNQGTLTPYRRKTSREIGFAAKDLKKLSMWERAR